MPDIVILLLGLAIILVPRFVFSGSEAPKEPITPGLSKLRKGPSQSANLGTEKMNTLPEVTITSTDRRRLVSLATAALPTERDGLAASMLLSEIARAHVVQPELLPPNIVAMNRDIEIRDNIKGTTEHLRIVFPDGEDASRNALSILTPVGVALIGLSEGASIEWCTAARDRKSLTVPHVRRENERPVLQT